MIRVLLFAFALMLPTLLLAGYQKSNSSESLESSYWKQEDCKKVSDASGVFLFISGQLLEEFEKKEKSGDKEEAVELFMKSVGFSELSANFAKSFEAYCKE